MSKTILPRIEFKYSWIYDDVLKELDKPPKDRRRFSSRRIEGYMKSVELLWGKRGKAILQELSKVTKLSWKEKKIPCYVVTWSRPFSDPLTVSVWKSKDYFLDILTHELIHRLFIQEGNVKRTNSVWNYFLKKYKNESYNTCIHIPLHAIHEHIFRTLFDEKRLVREYKIVKKWREYKRSWDIVRKEGYKNIIRQFVDRIH